MKSGAEHLQVMLNAAYIFSLVHELDEDALGVWLGLSAGLDGRMGSFGGYP